MSQPIRPRYSLLSQVVRLGKVALWFGFTVVGGTGLLVLSHLGVAATHGYTQTGLKHAQRAGFASIALLVAMLLMLGILGATVTAMRAQARKVGVFCALLVVSGMPWTFLCAAFAPYVGITDFWAPAGLGSAVGFVLWLKVLAAGTRGLA